MSDVQKTAAERLAEVAEKRAAREAVAQAAYDAQRATDEEAIEAILEQHPDVLTSRLDVKHSPGLVTCVLLRCPSRPELARFRQGVKSKNGENTNASATDAAELLAAVVVLYPERKGEDSPWKALCDARPAVAANVGVAAIKLAAAADADAGKD